MSKVKRTISDIDTAVDTIEFVQISDCHLYQDKEAMHYDANVYHNLCRVLEDIRANKHLSCIIFTGDLSQDHSELSYQHFIDALTVNEINLPIYYTPGNHDDLQLLTDAFSGFQGGSKKTIDFSHWQLQLVNSKSESPSGVVSVEEQQRVMANVEQNKYQLLLMHHHPVDVNYFIDRHGLHNKTAFYAMLDKITQVKAVACGHVHNALELTITTASKHLPLLTCPATSIQFDQTVDGVANAQLGPGYRHFTLFASGEVQSKAIFLAE
ncbi:3',5'-cyclic adenosine monophosphate phosphodiesterase CpdA [Thalassotalea insulae]|uniref:3',5'-cyclic adenosine monophosphate phosphodiesterase CpdA n=1 Tax=Thalassotalea insulae TaxID=2056778 RepID=A0ABQ6GUF8_9GAMM|nr:metallophosphoesterase [Thalassotalea insulae]GLX79575.1 3',5'-cyclic adenosine monophosphate phosphodiesterase CpdA [Thalassotalea insulae]